MFWFFYLFRIFATAFVVQVQLYDHAHAARSNEYDIAQTVDCSKMESNELISTMMNSICKPYYRHVPLKPGPFQEFHPTVVSVKQCDGNCPGNTCMPIKTRIVRVPIQLMPRRFLGELHAKCALAEVEEHLACRCNCQNPHRECPENQVFLRDQCACVCKDREFLKIKCEAEEGLWDEDTCSCNKETAQARGSARGSAPEPWAGARGDAARS